MMKTDNKRIQKIIEKYGDNITGIRDLTGDAEPSALFYLLADKLSYLLETDVDKVISQGGVSIRHNLHFIIKTLGKYFLTNPQVFENRNFLRNPQIENVAKDKEIILPDEPVIWTSNHAFKDDTLATILAAKRHAYILFGSLPEKLKEKYSIEQKMWEKELQKVKDGKESEIVKNEMEKDSVILHAIGALLTRYKQFLGII